MGKAIPAGRVACPGSHPMLYLSGFTGRPLGCFLFPLNTGVDSLCPWSPASGLRLSGTGTRTGPDVSPAGGTTALPGGRGGEEQAACLVRAQSCSAQALKHRLRDKLDATRRWPPGRRPHTRCSPGSPCRHGTIDPDLSNKLLEIYEAGRKI